MRSFAVVALAALLALAGSAANAGRIDPDLEARLVSAFPGEKIPVIVRMQEQANPRAVLRTLPEKAARKLRRKAIVEALRDTARRGQARLHADLAAEQASGEIERTIPFWVINGVAMHATERVIRRLAAREDVLEVRFDATIPPPPAPTSVETSAGPTEWNIAQIRAPEVWAMDPPYDGTGTLVGSFDTGVDLTHPDLFARYRGDHAISWFDPYGQHGLPVDFNGHGTHTTATAVGGNAGGSHIGVAPGAKWIAAKAWADSGNGTVSAFHQIFEWFLAPGGLTDNAPDVVNNSWALIVAGCSQEFLPDILAWRAAGIFPAFAAGNSGPNDGTVRSPGALAESFAVGATDILDEVAEFSSRGPSPCNGIVKPDVSAPGSSVRSAIPGGYGVMSGTSMATPHVAGAVAVLRSINQDLTVEELATILTLSATDLGAPGADDGYGAGRLDLLVAAEMAKDGFDKPLVRAQASVAATSENGTAQGLVTLSRSGSTEQPLDVRLSIGGTATPGADYVALPASVTIPAGAESVALPVIAVDDSELELNESVLVTLAPDPAYIVAWSRTASVIITSDEQFPDLSVSSLTVPSVAGSGEPLTFTETTTNRGSGPAPASVTRYLLSTNSAPDAGDTELGTRAIPPLAPGASSTATLTFTLPTLSTGTWYVIAVADAPGSVPESAESNNTANRQTRVGPDLDVLSLTLPSASGPGLSFAATDSVKNVGGGAAPASVTRYFLSFNASWDTGDALIGTRAVPALAGGATDTGSVTLTLPEIVAPGTWYVIALADADNAAAESVESNNTLSQTLRVGPDLDVTTLSVPASGGAGQSVNVTDTVRNVGGGTTAASTTRYFLSSDVTLDGGDEAIGSRSVPALDPGASDTGSAALLIPALTTAGTWYIVAAADADNAVAETSEINNTFVLSIKIGPDLDVTTLTVPASGAAGGTISVTAAVKSIGGGEAAPSLLRFVLSANTTYEDGDTELGTRDVPALAAGATSSATSVFTVPAGVATGTWYVVAVADFGNALSETSESNNSAYATIRIGPDLAVSALTGPAAIAAGQAITLTETTKNQGAGAAAATATHFVLSADSTFDAADEPLTTRAVPELAAGATSVASVAITMPAGLATGTWYVIAVADGGLALPETYETNNTRALAIRVGPDLVVSTMTGPSAVDAGQSISVTDTTRNSGAGGAAASVTHFYLSSNNLFEAAGDTYLGSRNVPALAPGATNAVATTLTVPAGTAIGAWYVIAVADADAAVAETSETNNVYALYTRVGADLSVTTLTVPAFGAAGQSVTVTDTTRNLAATTAPASSTHYFLSINTGLDDADIYLGSRDVPALGGGASSVGSATLTIPPDTPSRSWYVLARADGPGEIVEVSEANNILSRSIAVGPDLVVTALTAPSTGIAGQGVALSETTRNQGAAAAPATVTRYFLSQNSSLDAADTELGSRDVPALAGGASHASGTLTLVLPGVPAGTWYLIARSDALDGVTEASESNNVSSRSIKISAP